MTEQSLRCLGCNHRFGRRCRTVVFFESFALCAACANDPSVHRKIFVGCPTHHSPLQHGGDTVTLGRARQALNPQPERR